MLCAVVLVVYVAAITWAFPSPALTKFHSINVHENLWRGVALTVLMISAVPVMEELVFRGWLWTDLKVYWSTPAVMLFTGCTFLAAHLLDHPATKIPALVLPTIVFTAARYYADSVRATIALHVLYNFGIQVGVVLTVVLPHR